MSQAFRRQPGFGLLEVLFATAIFIIVVGSLVTLSRMSLRNAALAAHRTQATNLAQDGLETIRQMRDTGWMARKGQQASDDWLTYSISSRSTVQDPTCSAGIPGSNFSRPQIGRNYEICYNTIAQTFGLRYHTPSTDPAQINGANIALVTSDGNIDPAGPAFYRRTVRFEEVPTPAFQTCGTSLQEYVGLQLLAPNSEGVICTVKDYETYQGRPLYAVKVTSTVTWREFDRDWSVSLDTILTNWRTR